MAPNPKSTSSRVSKQKKNVYTPKKTRTNFLDIPTELREQIYNAVLNATPLSLYSLVLTGRQISREARPYLFKQSLVFDGQSELHEWLKTVNHSYLHYVTNIQFKLHDIDPDEIVGALGKRLRRMGMSGPPEPHSDPYKQACDMELGRLQEAFRLLPKVTHFTILTITKADPQPPYRMLYNFCKMLSQSLPNLISLTNHEDSLPMSFVAPLQKLRRLSFPGVTAGPSKEITKAFGELPSLTELQVCRPDPSSVERGRRAPYSVDGVRCDVPDIIRGISRLESFAFSELMSEDCQSGDDEQEMAEAIMESIGALERHKSWLRSLTIITDVDLEARMQKRIAAFIKSSRLKYLEMSDTDFPPFGYLPRTIETVVLRSSLEGKRFCSWLEKLVAMARRYNNELPSLAEIAICVDWVLDLPEAKHKAWAAKELRTLGIDFWWRRSEG